MGDAFDDAVKTLYQAPHDSFVAVRKQLAQELKSAGDKAGAARLAKLPRPPISAWAVNQLYWRSRSELDELFSSAALVRQGDLEATSKHRATLASLRAQAKTLLLEAGNAASEATLRRVTTTLSALAVAGSFDPDPPGALSSDREPPGFEGVLAPEALPATRPAAESNQAARLLARQQAEKAKKEAERQRLMARVRNAESELGAGEREVQRHRRALAEAEERLAKLERALDELKRQLSDLEQSE